MNLNYHFEFVGRSLRIFIEPNPEIKGYIHNIRGWLSSDVQSCGKDYLPKVKKVLEGEVNEEVFWGNAYKVIVHKENTKISYDYEEDNPEMIPCTLPTQMLYEILEIWIKACDEEREKEN